MFQSSEIRSAITLLLALGAVAPVLAADGSDTPVRLTVDTAFRSDRIQLAAAEGVSSNAPAADGGVADKASRPATDLSEAANAATWEGAAGTPLFGRDSTIGLGQQSATAGYELSGAGIASGAAPAQGAILTSPTRGRPVRFENGIFIYPAALIGFGRNDNLLGTTTNKLSSTFTMLRPEAVAELKRAGDRYTLSYTGNYARYNSSSADNYDHHELWAAADNYFTSRMRLGWGVGYIESSDARGSTNLASTSTPNRWHAPVARVLGIYGAPGAIGRAELESSVMQKRYDNNRSITNVSDVDTAMVAGRFYYRFMPKTSVLVEARNTLANYTLDTSTQDNNDRRYYAGLTWEATAKTTGTIKVGRAYKDFNDASRKDGSNTSWEGSVRWSPLTYSAFDLVTSKAPSDSTGVGNYTINTATNLTWNHRWASYISSRVSAGAIKTDYDSDSRRDDTRTYGVGFYRELGYRLRLGLDWTRTDRSSNQSANEFKRDVTMITLEGVL